MDPPAQDVPGCISRNRSSKWKQAMCKKEPWFPAEVTDFWLYPGSDTRNSSGRTVIRLDLMKERGSIPGRGKKSAPKRRHRLWDPRSLTFNGHRGPFPQTKAAGATAKVNSEWSYTSILSSAITALCLINHRKFIPGTCVKKRHVLHHVTVASFSILPFHCPQSTSNLTRTLSIWMIITEILKG